MAVVKISRENAKRIELDDGSYLLEMLIDSTAGTKKAMLGVSTFKAGFRSKNIVHEEDELAYIISGRGRLKTPDGEIQYCAGEAIYIPAGTPHIVINDSDEELSMVYVFTYKEYPPTRVLD